MTTEKKIPSEERVGKKVKTIVLIGPPGSGKGTLCQYLTLHQQDFSGKIVSLGFLLRQETLAQTELGQFIEAGTKNGDFLPGEIIEKIVFQELQKIPHETIIFDGFPRIESQQLWLQKILPQFHREIDHVVMLTLSHEKILERLSHRRICSSCDYVQAEVGNTDNCPHCEKPLVTRVDDNTDAVLRRIENYYNLTEVMFKKYYKDKIITIDSDAPIDQIYQQCLQKKMFFIKNECI